MKGQNENRTKSLVEEKPQKSNSTNRMFNFKFVKKEHLYKKKEIIILIKYKFKTTRYTGNNKALS